MTARAFKARCLSIIDEVQSNRKEVVITKKGRPIAKLVPVDSAQGEFYGFMKGKGRITGDIVSPVLSPEEWGDLYE